MRMIHSIRRMEKWAAERRKDRKTIGLVPTMGALHEGHLSLVRAARSRCDLVVVSLFVNPAQFGPGEDYNRYPRNLPGDARLCRREKTDILFIPSPSEVYPRDFQTRVHVSPLGDLLEGEFRPGHFSGVATVVAQLFQIVRPDFAFFGRKDYQQTCVVKKLVRDLHIPVRIVVRPTIREKDGLAMSSRNRYLSDEERRAAAILFSALREGKDRVREGERDPTAVRDAVTRVIRKETLVEIDYVAVVHPENLRNLSRIEGPAVLLVAARVGKTRLIDNITVSV